MALLRFGLRPWWSHIPIVGRLAPVERVERSVQSDPSLTTQVSSRPKGLWDWFMNLHLFGLARNLIKTAWTPKEDHLVVDTGERLVDIRANHLNLKGVRVGDEVEFNLDDAVDPGGATKVRGRVAMVADAPDSADPGARSHGDRGRLERPLDAGDPATAITIRRAELFAAFRKGEIGQDSLKRIWDRVRQEGLTLILSGQESVFYKNDQIARLLEMGALTPQEIADRGIQVVLEGPPIKDLYST